MKLHFSTNNQVEILALRKGLEQLGNKRLFVGIIYSIKIETNFQTGKVLKDCRCLMKQIHNCSLSHSYQEVNQVANCHAKNGRSLDEGTACMKNLMLLLNP